MPKVTGQVIKREPKQSNKGDSYFVVALDGQEQALFDWNGHCARAEVNAGDTVEIEYTGGRFPRIKSLKKLAEGVQEPQFAEKEKRRNNSNSQISRMCALKCAAGILQGKDLHPEKLTKQITALAEELHRWIVG